MSLIIVLASGVTLTCVFCLSRFLLNSLCFSVRRNSVCRLLLPVGIIALGIIYVGINNLLGLGNGRSLLNAYGLVSVIERNQSRRNSRSVLLLILSIVVIRGRVLLLSLFSLLGSFLDLGCEVGLNVAVNHFLNALCVLFLKSLLSEDLVCLFLTVDGSESLALRLLISLSTLHRIILIGGDLLNGVRNLYGLIIFSGISLDISLCGRNYADCRSFAIIILGNKQYDLLIFGIRTGKGSGILILLFGLSFLISSLDHDCRLVSLIMLSSSELLLSLSFFLVCGKKLGGLDDTGVTPLSLELFLKLLSCLDSKYIVSLYGITSILFCLISCNELLSLFLAGIYAENLLCLLGLFGLFCLFFFFGLLGGLALNECALLVSSFSSFERLLFCGVLLSFLLSLVLGDKRIVLVCRVRLLLFLLCLLSVFCLFCKRAAFGHGLKLADIYVIAKLLRHDSVLLRVGGNVSLGHCVIEVKITVSAVGII